MSTSKLEQIVRWENGRFCVVSDEVADEEPLEIRVRGRSISVTMRTPGHDDELAAGFLLTEGLVSRREDVLQIQDCDRNEYGNVINVQLAPEVAVDFEHLTRHVFASSSCGLCGKATIESVRGRFPSLTDLESPKVSPGMLADLPAAMRQTQAIFDKTGGLHAAALFDEQGKLLHLREDVGRHNGVDKILGRALLDGLLPLRRHILLVSGRVSFEIIQKTLAAGVPIVAAVSAPSSLAVQFASESGQTLVGFLRGSRMNVYTHPRRIAGA